MAGWTGLPADLSSDGRCRHRGIARAQVWQWIRYPQGVLDTGKKVTIEMFREALARHLMNIRDELGDHVYESRHFQAAGELLDRMITRKDLPSFLTLEAYGQL